MSRLSLLAIVLISSLTACGFHLRGHSEMLMPLPFQRVLVNGNSAVVPLIKSRLRTQNNVQVVENKEEKVAILNIINEQHARDLLTLNRAGRVSEYKLSYRINVELNLPEQEPRPISIIVHRDFPYSDSSILGKLEEEQLVWSSMREEATTLLFYRLAALHHGKSSH